MYLRLRSRFLCRQDEVKWNRIGEFVSLLVMRGIAQRQCWVYHKRSPRQRPWHWQSFFAYSQKKYQHHNRIHRHGLPLFVKLYIDNLPPLLPIPTLLVSLNRQLRRDIISRSLNNQSLNTLGTLLTLQTLTLHIESPLNLDHITLHLKLLLLLLEVPTRHNRRVRGETSRWLPNFRSAELFGVSVGSSRGDCRTHKVGE